MQSTQMIPVLLQQLGYQSPMLLVYMVGIVVALALLGKHPTPAMMVLVSMGLLLVTSVLNSFATAWIIAMREHGPGSNTSMLLSVTGILGSIMRALAIGVLVAAVFAGRKPAHEEWPMKEGPPSKV